MGALGHTLPTTRSHYRLEGIPPQRAIPPDSRLDELFQNQPEKLETTDPIITKELKMEELQCGKPHMEGAEWDSYHLLSCTAKLEEATV